MIFSKASISINDGAIVAEKTAPLNIVNLDDEITNDIASTSKLVLPGQNVTEQAGFMRGTGTYNEDEVLVSCLAGQAQIINKLVTVKPVKQNRYHGHVGDVIVGRISEVQQRRWKADVNGRLDATLDLSSVNLSGGELRRKSLEDELRMRQYLQEGDLISAEVQKIGSDGSIHLHTRSLKYGKLSQGIFVQVPCTLIARLKSFIRMPHLSTSLIIGKNGYIFIEPLKSDEAMTGGYTQDLNMVVNRDERELLCRVHNAITVLSNHSLLISEKTITATVGVSSQLEAYEMLLPVNSAQIAYTVHQSLAAD